MRIRRVKYFKLRQYKYDLIYKFLVKETFLISKTHLGHALSDWQHTNRNYILLINESQSIFNIESNFILIRKLIVSLINMFERSKMLVLLVNGLSHFYYKPENLLFLDNMFKRNFGYYYILRWIPGMLTNCRLYFDSKRIVKGVKTGLQKFSKLKTKILTLSMKRIPSLIIFLSVTRPYLWGVKESFTLNIPTIGIVDSNSFISELLYALYGNDDSCKSIEFYLKFFRIIIQHGKYLYWEFTRRFIQRLDIDNGERRRQQVRRKSNDAKTLSLFERIRSILVHVTIKFYRGFFIRSKKSKWKKWSRSLFFKLNHINKNGTAIRTI